MSTQSVTAGTSYERVSSLPLKTPPPLPCSSRIKWYDPVRRFGFVQPHDKGGDIWFNWLTLLRNKIEERAVEPDMMVHFSYSDPDAPTKQRTVVHMRIEK